MEEWEATPRRIRVSFFIWLADANARRAPLLVRPGSHRAIAEHNSSIVLSELRPRHFVLWAEAATWAGASGRPPRASLGQLDVCAELKQTPRHLPAPAEAPQ